MQRLIFGLLIGGLMPLFTRAQTTDSLNSFKGINVIQDARIYQILEYRREENRRLSASNQGYRLLIYSGSKRQEALVNQVSFKELYPKLETYLSYSFPNFKLMVGDFRNREDAQKVSDQLKLQLSLNPILLPQKIDLTKVYSPN